MTAPLRIRHLLKGLGPGGAERLVLSQTIASGPGHVHDVVYLLPWKDHLVADLQEGGVATYCLDTRSLFRPRWVHRLRSLLRTDPCDVLHIHSPAVASIARLVVLTLPRHSRPAVVTTEHNRWPRHNRVTRMANRLTIRLDDAVVAVSDDVKSTMIGVKPERVRVIVHGIDIPGVRASAARAESRAELGADDDDIVIICIANLRREKALDVLVRAATIALEQRPELRYAVVGQGPLATELDGWIKAAGIGDRFAALGYRRDATRVLSGADVFTLSSRHEGLPVAVMEALALGMPVAATAAGGVPAAVGSAGIISPVDDAGQLAISHLRLAERIDLRAEMATNAALESARFSVERAAAELDEVYATVTAGTAPRSSR